MIDFKKTLYTLLFLSGLTASAQFTDVINSNRPGESMSAFSVGKTVIQTEVGLMGSKSEHDMLMTSTETIDAEAIVRYGAIFEQLEFIGELYYANVSGVRSNGTDYNYGGLKQFNIGAKYLVYDPYKKYVNKKPNLLSWKANQGFKWRNLIPAVGVYAGANVKISDKFPPTSESRLSPKIMGITQNQLGRYVLVTNWILDRISSTSEYMAYIVTVTYGINDRWSAFVENQGIQSDLYGDLIFRGGAAYLIAENIQVDASIGASAKSTPSLINAGIGLSWRFDANYEDVLVRLPKDDKDKKKDKKDKKKNKRKDQVPEEGAPESE